MANSSFFSPIDVNKTGLPTQLEFTQSDLLTDVDEYGNTFTWRRPSTLATAGVQPAYYVDPNGSLTVDYYQATTPTIVNGIPAYAQYDSSGKLTGYQGAANVRGSNTLGESVIGYWDASGAAKPVPVSGGGGLFDSLANAVGGVGNAVTNTVNTALDNPLSTAAIVGTAIVAPELLPYVNAGSALAAGADPQRVALAVAAGQLGSQVSSGLADTLGKTGANIAGSTAAATVRGQDPLAALVSGGIGAGTSAVTSQIEGFDQLSPAQQRAVNTVVASELQGRDPSQALVNQALNAGIAAARNEYNGGTAVADGAGGSAAESLMGSGLGRLAANVAGVLPSSGTLSNLASSGIGSLIGGVTGGTISAGLTGNPLVNNYLNTAMPNATPQDTSSMLANNLIYQAGLASLLNSGSNQGVTSSANQLINPSDVGTLGPAQTNWPGGLGGGLLTSKITGEAINGQPANTSVGLQNAMNARRQYAA